MTVKNPKPGCLYKDSYGVFLLLRQTLGWDTYEIQYSYSPEPETVTKHYLEDKCELVAEAHDD